MMMNWKKSCNLLVSKKIMRLWKNSQTMIPISVINPLRGIIRLTLRNRLNVDSIDDTIERETHYDSLGRKKTAGVFTSLEEGAFGPFEILTTDYATIVCFAFDRLMV